MTKIHTHTSFNPVEILLDSLKPIYVIYCMYINHCQYLSFSVVWANLRSPQRTKIFKMIRFA